MKFGPTNIRETAPSDQSTTTVTDMSGVAGINSFTEAVKMGAELGNQVILGQVRSEFDELTQQAQAGQEFMQNLFSSSDGKNLKRLQANMDALAAGNIQGAINPTAAASRQRALLKENLTMFPHLTTEIKSIGSNFGIGSLGITGTGTGVQKTPQQQQFEKMQAEAFSRGTTVEHIQQEYREKSANDSLATQLATTENLGKLNQHSFNTVTSELALNDIDAKFKKYLTSPEGMAASKDEIMAVATRIVAQAKADIGDIAAKHQAKGTTFNLTDVNKTLDGYVSSNGWMSHLANASDRLEIIKRDNEYSKELLQQGALRTNVGVAMNALPGAKVTDVLELMKSDEGMGFIKELGLALPSLNLTERMIKDRGTQTLLGSMLAGVSGWVSNNTQTTSLNQGATPAVAQRYYSVVLQDDPIKHVDGKEEKKLVGVAAATDIKNKGNNPLMNDVDKKKLDGNWKLTIDRDDWEVASKLPVHESAKPVIREKATNYFQHILTGDKQISDVAIPQITQDGRSFTNKKASHLNAFLDFQDKNKLFTNQDLGIVYSAPNEIATREDIIRKVQSTAVVRQAAEMRTKAMQKHSALVQIATNPAKLFSGKERMNFLGSGSGSLTSAEVDAIFGPMDSTGDSAQALGLDPTGPVRDAAKVRQAALAQLGRVQAYIDKTDKQIEYATSAKDFSVGGLQELNLAQPDANKELIKSMQELGGQAAQELKSVLQKHGLMYNDVPFDPEFFTVMTDEEKEMINGDTTTQVTGINQDTVAEVPMDKPVDVDLGEGADSDIVELDVKAIEPSTLEQMIGEDQVEFIRQENERLTESINREALDMEVVKDRKIRQKNRAILQKRFDSGQKLDKQTFTFGLYNDASEAAAELNVDPMILIAQAALETGWGNSKLTRKSKNLFNIKSHGREGGTEVTANEFVDGKEVFEKSSFRNYKTFRESFLDYVDFLRTNRRYSKALKAKTTEEYIEELHKAGYATDPRYVEKIMSIYRGLKEKDMLLPEKAQAYTPGELLRDDQTGDMYRVDDNGNPQLIG